RRLRRAAGRAWRREGRRQRAERGPQSARRNRQVSSNVKSALLAAVAACAVCACRHSPPTTIPAAPSSRANVVQQLQHDIDTVLAAPARAHSFWGVLIKSLRSDETLYSLNAGKLFLPASNTKIVTLAATAERLGWDFTYDTRLISAAPIEDGALRGDLI